MLSGKLKSEVSNASRLHSSYNKRRLVGGGKKLFSPSQPGFRKASLDADSIITTDKLKKFNEIQDAGQNMVTEPEQPEAEALQNENYEGEVNAEDGDEVAALEEQQDEVHSVVSKAPTHVSAALSKKSGFSNVSKAYIGKLEKQLQEEKLARKKLE